MVDLFVKVCCEVCCGIRMQKTLWARQAWNNKLHLTLSQSAFRDFIGRDSQRGTRNHNSANSFYRCSTFHPRSKLFTSAVPGWHRIKGWILAAPGEQSGAPCRTNTLVRVAQPCGREELVFVPSPSPEHPPEPSGHRCVSGTAGKTHLALHSPAKPWAGDGSRQFVPMFGLCTGTHKPGISQGCPTPLSFLQLPQALLLQSSLSWGIFLEFYWSAQPP